MPRNWTHTLEERQDGLVSGFIGTDETLEHFEARTADEAKAEAQRLAAAESDTGDAEPAAPSPFAGFFGR